MVEDEAKETQAELKRSLEALEFMNDDEVVRYQPMKVAKTVVQMVPDRDESTHFNYMHADKLVTF